MKKLIAEFKKYIIISLDYISKKTRQIKKYALLKTKLNIIGYLIEITGIIFFITTIPVILSYIIIKYIYE